MTHPHVCGQEMVVEGRGVSPPVFAFQRSPHPL